jgi:hypothetical protein
MLREQMDDLLAEIKSARRERHFAPFFVVGFSLFIGFLNGEDVWGRPSISMKEGFLSFSVLVLIYGVFSIRIAILQSELRALMREYWGSGAKAPQDNDL